VGISTRNFAPNASHPKQPAGLAGGVLYRAIVKFETCRLKPTWLLVDGFSSCNFYPLKGDELISSFAFNTNTHAGPSSPSSREAPAGGVRRSPEAEKPYTRRNPCTQGATRSDCLLIVYRCTQGAAGPDCLLIVYRCTHGAARPDCGGPDCLLIVYRCTQGAETLNSVTGVTGAPIALGTRRHPEKP